MVYMTRDELTRLYRGGGCSERQIQILAELNGCEVIEIVRELVYAGYEMPEKYSKLVKLLKKQAKLNTGV